jgi:hypothetical protein
MLAPVNQKEYTQEDKEMHARIEASVLALGLDGELLNSIISVLKGLPCDEQAKQLDLMVNAHAAGELIRLVGVWRSDDGKDMNVLTALITRSICGNNDVLSVADYVMRMETGDDEDLKLLLEIVDDFRYTTKHEGKKKEKSTLKLLWEKATSSLSKMLPWLSKLTANAERV